MDKKEKSYYAVIPADVRYDKKLKPNEKLLYGEITALCNEKGFCWASNKYFAELYSVSTTSVSLWIKNLSDNGYIEIEIEKNYSRKLYLKGVLRKVKGGFKENLKGVLKKVKYNNTVNNTNNIKDNNIAKQGFADTSTGKQINELLKEFEEVNPMINYGNKTQRKTLEEMIKKWGYEKTLNTIKASNKIQGEKFAPTITTPIQLKNKLGELLVYYKKETNNQPMFVKI